MGELSHAEDRGVFRMKTEGSSCGPLGAACGASAASPTTQKAAAVVVAMMALIDHLWFFVSHGALL
jgi:hypothetical protein